jgi:hypothetical protein
MSLSAEELKHLTALLSESYRYHRLALDLRLRQQTVEAKHHLATAQQLRLEALALDPERKSLPWKLERKERFANRDVHPELMRFYEQHVGVPVTPEEVP